MDIVALSKISRRYTFHSHTQFCDGHAPMEDFARAAIVAGFSSYGFSPHSPLPIPSGCNMRAEDVTAYLAEVERLREMFADSGTRFFAGMEIDYLHGGNWGPAIEYFQTMPLDFRIGSVHFLPDKHGGFVDIDGSAERFISYMSAHFDNDIRYVVETFYEASAAMIEAGGFDILGHFDKIAQNASVYEPGLEDRLWYQSLVNSLIDLIIERRPIVEINTKHKQRLNRIFPGERYLPRLVKAGVPIVVNSDAHDPHLIDASRDYAFDLLDKLSCNC